MSIEKFLGGHDLFIRRVDAFGGHKRERGILYVERAGRGESTSVTYVLKFNESRMYNQEGFGELFEQKLYRGGNYLHLFGTNAAGNVAFDFKVGLRADIQSWRKLKDMNPTGSDETAKAEEGEADGIWIGGVYIQNGVQDPSGMGDSNYVVGSTEDGDDGTDDDPPIINLPG